MTACRLRIFAGGGALVAIVGCGLPSAPADAVPSAAPASPVVSAPPPAQSATPASSAPAPTNEVADAGSDARGGELAASPEPRQEFAADNRILPPAASDELTERARGLFEAITRDDAALGEPFWFPREPFIPLKDVKGPERYWETLHSTYLLDIRALHRKRKSWNGAEFVGFVIGSTPKWVKPGDEANKVGYYRSFRGKLRYRMDQEIYSIEVHTIISWQGKWYITHLRKFKK